jgi:hypothetical protein
MHPEPQSGNNTLVSIPIKLAVFLARHALNYISYVFRVPVLLCFVTLVCVLVIILQETYPRLASMTVLPLLVFLPQDIHLDLPAFIKFYALFSGVWYAGSLPFRKWFRQGKPTHWSQFKIIAGIATAGWGIVLGHVPVMRIAPGSTRMGLAFVFFLFYLLTIGAFAAAVFLSYLADLVVQAGNVQLDKMRELSRTT